MASLTDINYWESSPKYGRGNSKYKTEGDAHDWWIWHDEYPFEHLEENVPRFMSEFGFQSFPSYETIRYITQDDSLEISSDGFKNHQKHARGFQLIETYMKRDFPIPNSTEDYVYMSQVLQAYGITKGIEAQRRAKPHNMGTLYWQLNDCWPAVSWSSIDYFGNWKALQYKLKQSYNDVLISSKIESDTVKTYIVNDNLEPEIGELSISISDLDGNVLWNDRREIIAEPNSSAVKYELPVSSIKFLKDEIVLRSHFKDKKEFFYFVKPKDLKLKSDDLETKLIQTPDGFKIRISSKTFQKDVFLSTKQKGRFHDNFFDLFPDEVRWIHFKTDADALDDLEIKSFNNFIR